PWRRSRLLARKPRRPRLFDSRLASAAAFLASNPIGLARRETRSWLCRPRLSRPRPGSRPDERHRPLVFPRAKPIPAAARKDARHGFGHKLSVQTRKPIRRWALPRPEPRRFPLWRWPRKTQIEGGVDTTCTCYCSLVSGRIAGHDQPWPVQPALFEASSQAARFRDAPKDNWEFHDAYTSRTLASATG